MTKKLIGIGAGVILISVLVFIIFFNNAEAPNPEPGNGGGSSTTFPIGGSTPPPGEDERIPLATPSGILYVKNFLDASATIPDSSNEGYYFLGNTFLTADNAAAPSPTYVISYIAETQYFNISLLKEPIARVRTEAEQYLMAYLGISTQEMCALNYMVSTPNYVNSFYTGSSLGFSFCSGSIPLE